ncbi:altronate dehydratase family protein [Compostibacter hankyongensis]|uniref:Altronate dehydratase family protein n=1 Tax=Compostibacter hankyongensis TaxID=1007089 RepID=A0ABP8FTC4_9BACT
MNTKAICIHPRDNVMVALTDLPAGETIDVNGRSCTLTEPVPVKHKFAVTALKEGDAVTMYGVLVGRVLHPIPKGGLLTVKNVKHASGGYGLGERKTDWQVPDVTKWKDRTFMGFHRADGSVGTANYWLLIPLVFCENRNVQVLAEAFVKELGYALHLSPAQEQVRQLAGMYRAGKTVEDILGAGSGGETTAAAVAEKVFPNVDGVKLLTHTLGCGGVRDDTRALCGLLAGYITHPNVAGATVLSLGCQNAQISLLKEEIDRRDRQFSKPLYILEQQAVGNETVLLREAVKQTFAGLMQANECVRRPAPLDRLCLGLECGGSDGFSGISANPALGYASDLLVALGGSVILSEFPELCGVEQELSDRCVDEATAGRFMELMTRYQERARAVGSGFDSNPSAGNVRDGLITDAIKSAGAAKKGGTSPVTDVLDYPEKVRKKGLTLLCTPGSDIESTTAEVGAGASIVVFTTGLGTPTGNPVAPVLKVSSNTRLFEKMNDIIDIDAGAVIRGESTIEEVGEQILESIIKVAGGEAKAKATANGHDDFIPWKRGISL